MNAPYCEKCKHWHFKPDACVDLDYRARHWKARAYLLENLLKEARKEPIWSNFQKDLLERIDRAIESD